MKIREATARKLLKALGYEHADTYAVKVLTRRLAGVLQVDESKLVAVSQSSNAAVLKSVMNAVRRGESIEVLEGGHEAGRRDPTRSGDGGQARHEAAHDGATEDGSGPDGPGRLPAAKGVLERKGPYPVNARAVGRERPVARVKVREQTAREAALEFAGYERTEKTPHKKGGICRTVFDLVRTATEDRPVTKDEVWKMLKRKFPLRSPESLRATVGQFPHWLPRHYPFKVHQDEGRRFWLTPRLKWDK